MSASRKFNVLDAIDDPKLVALIIAITDANGVDLTDPKNTYVGEIEPWILDEKNTGKRQ